jgi:hypothetical protein
VGISGTIARDTISAAGGVEGDAYTYYKHHLATSVEGIDKLIDLALVRSLFFFQKQNLLVCNRKK